MEMIISNLLSDFEHGKLTRRQLIKALAVTSGAAMSLPVAQATPGKGFRTMAVNHLGMQVKQDDGKQCFLTFGESFLIPRNRPSNTPRIDHIAYTIENWDKNAVETELQRRGLKPIADTENSFHVEDPNGFDLQISGKDMKP